MYNSKNSFNTKQKLLVDDKEYHYFSLMALANEAGLNAERLPFTLKILLENMLRFEDGKTVFQDDIKALIKWQDQCTIDHEIAYRPARVLMQDFTGVPAIVDLAAMRDATVKLGGKPNEINPDIQVDLVIDHSVQVDEFATNKAFGDNVRIEMQRNHERYEFLKWGQNAFDKFHVVPPGTGICHQVNLEHIAKVAWTREFEKQNYVFPDTLVGTDSHTTMINGLGVLGWGVGGIEAEAGLLGQPISMLIPDVIGFELTGKLPHGATATDLVLTITQMLRKKGVVGKFVEFFGEGLADLPLADRATIANMAPEYGATCGFFPVDELTLSYLELSGRSKHTIKLVETYCKAQGLWHDYTKPPAHYTDVLSLDLASITPSLAGPSRPQDRVTLTELPTAFDALLAKLGKEEEKDKAFPTSENYQLHHGDVVIAAITSCTNTSNPKVLMTAGLLAKKAVEKGLVTKPWVKTSLAPGSKVVTDYLEKADLQKYLDELGFYLVGYGCTTCIGNSGPLPEPVNNTVSENNLAVSAVLSGNRNFDGRIHPLVKASWLASPPLVVAYALAGTTCIDLSKDPIGTGNNGEAIYLKDIWPSNEEIAQQVQLVKREMFEKEYAKVFDGDENWQAIKVEPSETYQWQTDSTYIQNPPFFTDMKLQPEPLHNIKNATILAMFADSVTTDHISPAGNIKADSPAGLYLQSKGVAPKDFNSFGSRRGNHEVMMRGTFANIRIRNEMVPNVEGGVTIYIPDKKQMPIYDAAMKYMAQKTPLVVIAGKDYGMGSSRDWAAKGTALLGVKAVIAESYERIHRSNLIGMGVLPLQFNAQDNRQSLKLTGYETITINGLDQEIKPQSCLDVVINYEDGQSKTIQVLCRLDTENEAEYYLNGGILQYVLRKLIQQ